MTMMGMMMMTVGELTEDKGNKRRRIRRETQGVVVESLFLFVRGPFRTG